MDVVLGDYDLGAALGENGYRGLIPEITKIVATIEGENDGANWHWLVRLRNGWAYITGGCDYTGWD